MILKALLLRNFRNYKEKTFHFSPNLNVIFGKNALGKTNILEAIYLLSTGRSFRTPFLKNLIKQGENYFYIEAEIIKDGVSQKIKIFFDNKTKKIFYNTKKLPSFINLLGIMPSTIHSPYDVDLISGYPSSRRRFLNLYLAQVDPLYIHHLSRFFKALKQRNYLLKKGILTTIDIFENEMAKSATYLGFARKKHLLSLKNPLSDVIKVISDRKENISIRYMPGFRCFEDMKKTFHSYLNQLEETRKKDLFLKTTQFGPHRDDFLIHLSGKNVKNFASEGQKRSIMIALKIAEYKLLCKNIQGSAIMNIDDLGIHLDMKRQNLLKSVVESLNQVFITTPIFPEIWKESNLIELSSEI
jgi:DNA replication and repair protein RecF